MDGRTRVRRIGTLLALFFLVVPGRADWDVQLESFEAREEGPLRAAAARLIRQAESLADSGATVHVTAEIGRTGTFRIKSAWFPLADSASERVYFSLYTPPSDLEEEECLSGEATVEYWDFASETVVPTGLHGYPLGWLRTGEMIVSSATWDWGACGFHRTFKAYDPTSNTTRELPRFDLQEDSPVRRNLRSWGRGGGNTRIYAGRYDEVVQHANPTWPHPSNYWPPEALLMHCWSEDEEPAR